MDGTWAIEHNREALGRILAALVAMAGLLGGQFTFFRQEGGSGEKLALAEKSKLSPTLPRQLHRVILRLLRPAESAARRLIIAYTVTPQVREIRELAARQARLAASPRRAGRP